VTYKNLNIGLRITAAGLCRNLTCFPYTECTAKVLQKLHIRKIFGQKVYFYAKKSFYAYFCSEIAKLTSKDDIFLHFFWASDKFCQFDIVSLQRIQYPVRNDGA
jgi:hypothetical protein